MVHYRDFIGNPLLWQIHILLLNTVMLAISAVASATPPLPAVIVAEAHLADFADHVESLGTLRANESVRLTASVTEIASVIHFDDGDRVEAGKVLVEMTSAEEHALLEEAKSTVAEARRQYRRVKSLEAQGKTELAAAIAERFDRAFSQADAVLTTSRF